MGKDEGVGHGVLRQADHVQHGRRYMPGPTVRKPDSAEILLSRHVASKWLESCSSCAAR